MAHEVEQLLAAFGEPADAKRHGAERERLRGARPERVRLLRAQRREAAPGHASQVPFLRCDRRRRSHQPRGEHPALAPGERRGQEFEGGRGELRRPDLVGGRKQLFGGPLEHQRLVRPRQRPQAQVHQHDHAERPERPGLESRQVVAGDVLHHAAAALDDAPVAGDERDAEQVVAHRAEPGAQRTGGARRDDRPERATRDAGGIQREPGAPVGELLAQGVPADARLGGGHEVLRLDRRDAV